MSGILGVGSRSGVIGTTELDYEVGTWDIRITDSASGSMGVNSGYLTQSYIKIGNLVNARGKVETTTETAGSGAWRFSLPFAVTDLEDGGNYTGHTVFFYRTANSALYNPVAITSEGTSYFTCAYNNISNNEIISFDATSTDATMEMFFNVTYHTA